MPGDQATALLFLMEYDRRRWQAERQRELTCYQIQSQKADAVTTTATLRVELKEVAR